MSELKSLSVETRADRVLETQQKANDMLRYANQLVAEAMPNVAGGGGDAGPTGSYGDDYGDLQRPTSGEPLSTVCSGGGGHVASLEEMRKKLEELDALRNRMAESNDKRHRIAILQDEVVAAEGRVVDLIATLEAVTIQLAASADDVDDLREKEASAREDLRFVEQRLPGAKLKVSQLTTEEDDIRKQLVDAQAALDRCKQVADETEANIQKILKGTMFEGRGGIPAPLEPMANAPIRAGHSDEDELPAKSEKWSYTGSFVDSDQQRLALKMEKQAAAKHEEFQRAKAALEAEVDTSAPLEKTHTGYDVKRLLGKIEEASPSYYSRPQHHAPQNDLHKDEEDSDDSKGNTVVDEAHIVVPPTPQSAAISRTESTFNQHNHASDAPTPAEHKLVAFSFQDSSSPRRVTTPSSDMEDNYIERTSNRVGAESGMVSRRMSLGVAQHTVSRLNEKIAALEKTLERKEKRIKEVEAVNAATQDRFGKMRVELLTLRRGLALLGTVESEGPTGKQGGDAIVKRRGSRISLNDPNGVLAKLREMAGNKEARLEESYRLAEKLAAPFLSDNGEEVGEEGTAIMVGPSPSSDAIRRKGPLSSQTSTRSIVHKKTHQYKLLEDLRAEIRFYEAERVSLYSRLYGLKENGGQVPSNMPSALKQRGSGERRSASVTQDSQNEIAMYGNSLLPPVVPIYIDGGDQQLIAPTKSKLPSLGNRPQRASTVSLTANITINSSGSQLSRAVKARRSPSVERSGMGNIQNEIETELRASSAPGGQLYQQRVIDNLRVQLRKAEGAYQNLRVRYVKTLWKLEMTEGNALLGHDSYLQGRSDIEEKISEVITAATKSQKELVEKSAQSAADAKKSAEEISRLSLQNEALLATSKNAKDELFTTRTRLTDATQTIALLNEQLRSEHRRFAAEDLHPLDQLIKKVREREALPSGNAQSLQHRLNDATDDLLLQLEGRRSHDFQIPLLYEADEALDAATIKQVSESHSFAELNSLRGDMKEKKDLREKNIAKRRRYFAEAAKPVGECVLSPAVQGSILSLASTVRGVFKEFVSSNPNAAKAFQAAIQNLGVLADFWEMLPQGLSKALNAYTEGIHGSLTEEFVTVLDMTKRRAQADKENALQNLQRELRSRFAGKILLDNTGTQTDRAPPSSDDSILEIAVPMDGDDNGETRSSSPRGLNKSLTAKGGRRQSKGGTAAAKRRTSSISGGGAAASSSGSLLSKATAKKPPTRSSSLAHASPPTGPSAVSAGHSPHLGDPAFQGGGEYYDSDEEELFRSHRSVLLPAFESIAVNTDMTLEELECVVAGCEAYQLHEDAMQHLVSCAINTDFTLNPDEADFIAEQIRLEKKVEELKRHLTEMISQVKQFKQLAEDSSQEKAKYQGLMNDAEYELVCTREEITKLRKLNGSTGDAMAWTLQAREMEVRELRARLSEVVRSSLIGLGDADLLSSLLAIVAGLTEASEHSRAELSALKDLLCVAHAEVAGHKRTLEVQRCEAERLQQQLEDSVTVATGLRDELATLRVEHENVQEQLIAANAASVAARLRVSSAKQSSSFPPPRPATGSNRPSTPSNFPPDFPVRNISSREGGARRSLYLSRPGSGSTTASRVGVDEDQQRPSTQSLRFEGDSGATPLDGSTRFSFSPTCHEGDCLTLEEDDCGDDNVPAASSDPSQVVAVDPTSLVVEEMKHEDDVQDEPSRPIEGSELDTITPSTTVEPKSKPTKKRQSSMPLGRVCSREELLRRMSYESGASRVSLLPQQHASFRRSAASPRSPKQQSPPPESRYSMSHSDGAPHEEEGDFAPLYASINEMSGSHRPLLTHRGDESSASFSYVLPRKRSSATAASFVSSKPQLPPLLRNPSLPPAALKSTMSVKSPRASSPKVAFQEAPITTVDDVVAITSSIRDLQQQQHPSSTGGPFKGGCTRGSEDNINQQLVAVARSSLSGPVRVSDGTVKRDSTLSKRILRVASLASATSGGNDSTSRTRLTVSRQRVSITPDVVANHASSFLQAVTPKSNAGTKSQQSSTVAHGTRSPPPSATELNQLARITSPKSGGKPYTRPVVPVPISPKHTFTLLRGTSVSDQPM